VAGKTLADATQEVLAIANRPGGAGRRGDAGKAAANDATAKQPARPRSRIEPVLEELIFRLEPAAPATE
jgi:hypothetical protein